MKDHSEDSLKRFGDFFDNNQKRSGEEEKVELGKIQTNISNSSTPKIERPAVKRSSPRNSILCAASSSTDRSTIKRSSPRNRRSGSPEEKVPRREISAHEMRTTSPDFQLEKQDSNLNATQSFSAQEESCSSAVLFDNTMDTSENKLTPGPNVSPELYSEPLDEESTSVPSNEGNGEALESQELGFSMSDSCLAQCGGLTQVIPGEHHNVIPEEHHNVIPEEHHNMIPEEHHNMIPEEHHNVIPEEHHNMIPEEQHNMIPGEHHNMIPGEHHNVIPEEHHNQQQDFDGISSLSDDMIARHCDLIMQEIDCQQNKRRKNNSAEADEVNGEECQEGTFQEERQGRGDDLEDLHGVKRQEQKHQDYSAKNPKTNHFLSDKDREAKLGDADDIVGEFDSGGRFQSGMFVSGPCSPANTCSLSSLPHPSSPRPSHEENKEEDLETTGSFSLSLSLSESPFDGDDVGVEVTEKLSEKTDEIRAFVRSNGMDHCSVLGNTKSTESRGTHGFCSDGPKLKCLSKRNEQVNCSDRKASFTRIKSKKIDSKNQQLPEERPETPCNLESGKRILVVETPESDAFQSSLVTPSNEATDSNPGSLVIDDPASPSCTYTSVNIVDVSANELLFHHFIKEWKVRKEFSFALGCERVLDNVPKIGGRFNKGPLTDERTSQGLPLEGTDEAVVGLAVCWGGRDAYYISLKDCSDVIEGRGCADQSVVASNLSVSTRLEAIKSVLEYKGKRKGIKFCFDSTAQYKALAQCSGITLSGEVEDPKVAAWLLDPSAKEKSLHHLVAEFISDKTELLEGTGAGFGCGSLGLASQSSMSGRARSCTEAVVTYWLMKHLGSNLKKDGLDGAFYQVEMPVMKCLARMELNGVGFSEVECERLKTILQGKLRSLEETAYKLANHSFSLTTPDDVATVLFLELKLPVDGKLEENSATEIKRRTLGTTRRVPTAKQGRKQLKHLSTNKEVLERLKVLHPLPSVILEWRRVNCALTKVVYPVQREKMFNPRVNMSRIYTTSQIHTATGRVSFSEPNLQNVQRDFNIDLPSNMLQIKTQGAQSMNHFNDVTGSTISVSMRNTFVPFEGGVMLAADYSQLELRLIADLSGDERLLKLLNAGGDVFKMIAGSLSGVEPAVVTDVQRQQAKQICYGIIYGMGAKSLGEQLDLSEDDASVFIEKFKSRFKGIRKYLKTTVENCKKDGFVRTVTKRRRYLPGINSTNAHARSQAERQAVNTTVQGSAADLVKIAMINIDRKLSEMFPTTCRATHRHKIPDNNQVEITLRRRSSRISAQTPGREASSQSTQGAFMVLQLHDELIVEVTERDLYRVATMVKKEMETAMKLSVVLPVKLKAGPSWGAMSSMEL